MTSHLSRRGFFASAGLVPALSHSMIGGDQFTAWWTERERLLRVLEVTSEDDEGVYERLMDDVFRLERLIVETPSATLVAVRLKARIVLWLMHMESHDGLCSMQDISDFLEVLT